MKQRQLMYMFAAFACLATAPALEGQGSVTGIWVTNDFGADRPIVIDLYMNGNWLAGTINNPTTVEHIYESTLSGGSVTFKANRGPSLVVTFMGRIEGDQIVFTRSVEV